MGRTVAFIIPGNPVAKGRPRAGKIAGRVRMFTPAATVRHENAIGTLALPHFPTPMEGPVRLVIEAVFVPATSWSKRRRAEALGRPHTQKPDLDNLAKAVCDGINRIAFADDSQIAELQTRKLWGEVAETRVTVEAL